MLQTRRRKRERDRVGRREKEREAMQPITTLSKRVTLGLRLIEQHVI